MGLQSSVQGPDRSGQAAGHLRGAAKIDGNVLGHASWSAVSYLSLTSSTDVARCQFFHAARSGDGPD
jgi:hypothetical protein